MINLDLKSESASLAQLPPRRPRRPSARSAPPAIQVNGLTRVFKTYKKQPGLKGAIRGLFRRQYEVTTAAADIHFQVEPGELVGFLGPNGAGKTTTLKMLAGLLYPTSGAASVLGFTPWERHVEYRRQFSLLLGQKNQLWWDLPARDSLELNAKIYGISRSQFDQTVGELTEMLQVQDKLNVMVRELSLGERMKMELIAGLLHRPKVLFLDEPTIGLDVVSQNTVREFLKAYNAIHQPTILLTSHYMADIEALCRRVIIIDHGRIIFDGPLAEVTEHLADYKLVTLQGLRLEQLSGLNWRGFGEIVDLSASEIRLRVKRSRVIPVCKELLHRVEVADISVQDVPIEWIVREIFSRKTGVPGSRAPAVQSCLPGMEDWPLNASLSAPLATGSNVTN